jgi:transcriptional regulator with XRE-family HTH domain
MTEVEYERDRAELGDRKDAKARWDQELAALFIRSGWTQEQLAAKEGKSQRWVSYNLTFGRFLSFSTMVLNSENLPKNLTERRFREYWEQTTGTNERRRFTEVQRLMAEHLHLQKEKGPAIVQAVNEYADGKWHALDKAAQKLGVTEEQCYKAIRRTIKFRMEKKKVGKSHHFRLFPRNRIVSTQELTTKLGPIIKDLKAEGKKNMATMAPAQVAYLAGLLEDLLDTWTKGPQ